MKHNTQNPETIIAGYIDQQYHGGQSSNGKDYRKLFRDYLRQVVGYALTGYKVPADLDSVTLPQLRRNDSAVRRYHPFEIPLIAPFQGQPVTVQVGGDGATVRAFVPDHPADPQMQRAHQAYPSFPTP